MLQKKFSFSSFPGLNKMRMHKNVFLFVRILVYVYIKIEVFSVKNREVKMKALQTKLTSHCDPTR